MRMNLNKKIIKVNELKCYFNTDFGVAKAVDGVSLELYEGDTLGIVGESGCGKSVTALSIMRLIEQPPGDIVGGEIFFKQKGNLLELSESEMRKIRGKEISMIFQEPMTSLNPLFTVGKQVSEVFRLHQNLNKRDAWEKSIEMLKVVKIPSPEKRAKDYPHQLSGGMRQRIMIAMALSCNPSLMIADEPTTALDVTIHAQILELINDMKVKIGTSVILITHDLGVVAEMSNYVNVMYAGVIVESADVYTLFKNPIHPYTKGLLTSIPRIEKKNKEKKRLNTIPGNVPSLLNLKKCCRFKERCPFKLNICKKEEPKYVKISENHFVRCWLVS